MMTSRDAQMLEDVLQSTDLSNGLYLMISSPGGDAVAAERIINICKAHSATNEYKVIVPEKAKSAASMVCLGASEIMASATSELGPVDPQITSAKDGPIRRHSVQRLVDGYSDLFERAVQTKGHIEPFLLQL